MTRPWNGYLFNNCFLLGLALLGCTASVGDPARGGGASTGTGNSGGQPGTGSMTFPGGGGSSGAALCDGITGRRLRPLSIREYSNVVSDLLGPAAGAVVAATLPADNLVTGFDNQGLQAPWYSDSLQDATANLAATLSGGANPAALAPCATPGGSSACLQTFIRSFANKAYGRPLADDEFMRANSVASMGQDYATSVRLVVELVLQSPYTLYVSELGSPTTPLASGKPIALTQYEIASQLSLLLTGTRPDATLLKAAETTGFTKPTAILAEAQRILSTDTRAKAALTRFIGGWMDMSPLTDTLKDPVAYPTLTPAILTAMQQEFDQFVTTQLNSGDGTLSSFMMGMSTNVPAALAPVYGADLLPSGLDPKHRRGILSLPAVLTVHSGANHSGPVERGLLVRRQLLCQYIPGAPPDALARIAANNPLESGDRTTTTRQKLEQIHLDTPSCNACHASFDPIGFGFEQMDAMGRFRTTENGLTIDSTGQLTGTAATDGTNVDGPFEGPAQLSAMLAPSRLLESCMAEHFFSFSQARPVVTTDKCVVNEWASTFMQGGGHIKDLVLTSVVHPSFVTRKDDR
jgi:Protein of unknown function (DUF1588)/Protein of unknown function (DUF1592)/Protein of unknown function (DUF1595)/Protein of unknown function (DUF1585)/Protein of unknown function (DUF1587)